MKTSRKRKNNCWSRAALSGLALPLAFISLPVVAKPLPYQAPTQIKATQTAPQVQAVRKLNNTTAEVILTDGQRMVIDFYGNRIFRLFQDNKGGIVRDPEAKPEAQILTQNARTSLNSFKINDQANDACIETSEARIIINKQTGLFQITDLRSGKIVVEETAPIRFDKDKVVLSLKENPTEYFYGGGVQNGRFSHKGKAINIVNENSWTDGGVASPAPFYWSTGGYGMMWHTFAPGCYDFGAKQKGTVELSHESDYLDVFFMIGETPVENLQNFYQLTGHPVLLPKFAFYEGHLNAYNRDYWKESTDSNKGIPFEDGKRYTESQKDNGGTKESLNGEKNNYQFSARAVIDRYKNHDMPLGWILPNDGYGAGYGQTETLDGNIQNLKDFGDYARKNGVEIGLWTQSDLHPKEGISALLQRDIVKEVRDAGVRVLKTDVAWVGDGYSFGLNGVADVGGIMPYYGDDARPFIISLDGWAGTQRYAGIWSGDQVGGEWEYIRFHIPTYIGSGLSGQPNITSDMDGIFGGKNIPVNVRDFEWKAFTPMQLNMDGWGSNEKYPHALGEPATSINRWYLKLKSELLPYAYSYAHEAITEKPMIRAMFLDYPSDYTHGSSTRYQYLFGEWFLIAPIYQNTKADENGNDVRNGIYLPEGQWIDYFTGDIYEGGRILNNYPAPLWKLPVFVKNGAIIPMNNPNNNVHEIDNGLRIFEIYPAGHTQFKLYDDDGTTEAYRRGEYTVTLIESNVNKNKAEITIHRREGINKDGLNEKATEFRINCSQKPKKVTASLNGNKKNALKLTEVNSIEQFKKGNNVYFYNAAPELNQFATTGSEFAKTKITKNPQLWVKIEKSNIDETETTLLIENFAFNTTHEEWSKTGEMTVPTASIAEEDRKAYTLKPQWTPVTNADYYEIEFDNMVYSTIRDGELLFENLEPETDYSFKIRAVNKDGHTAWNEFSARTQNDPLEFAIRGLSGEVSVPSQDGFGVSRLFDFAEGGDLWHTEYGKKAVPFDLTVDLNSINQLDKFQYLPRPNAGNGTLLEGKVFYSADKKHWTEAGDFKWGQNKDTKEFVFAERPTVRYIRLSVSKAVGNYGSGAEFYAFKVPGTESLIPGDVNHDGKLDENDLTSYMNYTGLRKGDKDFDGYISKGDLNGNNLIDAADISAVGIKIRDGVSSQKLDPLAGKLVLSANKTNYAAGETIEIKVKGEGLVSVNAFSFALPYNTKDYEFIGIEPIHLLQLENLTNDRLHSDGSKVLYPTFVNLGEQKKLEGSEDLFIIRMKAKHALKFNLKMSEGLLVDNRLNEVTF